MKRPTTVIIFALVFFLFIVFLMPRVAQVEQLRARSKNLEGELKTLQTQNLAMENELRLLKDDPVYLEKVARAKFSKAKKGEIVYKVVRE